MPTKKIVIYCTYCKFALRIPSLQGFLKVTCPKCKEIFLYSKETNFDFKSRVQFYISAGILGGIIGFFITEYLRRFSLDFLDQKLIFLIGNFYTYAGVGLSISVFLSSVDGFYLKDQKKFWYGVGLGVLLGILGGLLSGILAQLIFKGILSISAWYSIGYIGFFLARVLGWSFFGFFLGLSYGVKENTIGDLKYGGISGILGGFLSGVLFEPIAFMMNSAQHSRLVGFSILGGFLGFSIKYFQERAIIKGEETMFKQLTRHLPENNRLEKK